MNPRDYVQFTSLLRKEFILRGIHFIQGNNGTFCVQNAIKPNYEYTIFINEKGLCYVSKGKVKNGLIDLLRRDKKIINRQICIETVNYKCFLESLDSDEIYKRKYGFSQNAVIDLAFVLCFDIPQFIKT
ncbi:MAG: hypothetical protein J6K42_03510 [Clostridia bacterium]|nr:hypothetical protein [Clostridia bacterium]